MKSNDQERPRGKAAGDTALFSKEEKAAMQAHIKELKAARGGKKASKADGERDLRAAIEAMPPDGRALAERLHTIITANAPDLSPKTWYGMPAYANKDGKVVLFFRGAEKFKERYMTLGFNQDAKLDSGNMWPIAYAVLGLGPDDEKMVAKLVKQSVG